ncbi:MAG: hypothetical protein HY919_02435 [Elusimicrobia bacterium]|nr:hypothetical protein [Elusimicrobiota bacterium]
MKNFKWWQWILIVIAIGAVFYIVYPKYYFTGTGHVRCNKITGVVEENHFGGSWNRIGKENLFIRFIEKIKLIFESKKEKKKREMMENLGALRSALTIYYGVHEGIYPKSLQDLVPKYLRKIPEPENEWEYNPKDGEVYSKSYSDF